MKNVPASKKPERRPIGKVLHGLEMGAIREAHAVSRLASGRLQCLDHFRSRDTSMKNIAPNDAAALEAIETREWLDSLDYVLGQGDKSRVIRLLDALRIR